MWTWRPRQDLDELILHIACRKVEMSRSNWISALGAQEGALGWACISGRHWLCLAALGVSDPVREGKTRKDTELENLDGGETSSEWEWKEKACESLVFRITEIIFTLFSESLVEIIRNLFHCCWWGVCVCVWERSRLFYNFKIIS